MAQILVRDLSQEAVDRLKRRARANNRSLQGEVKAILEEATTRLSPDELRAIAEKWRKRWGGLRLPDSTALIRESRDNR